LPARLLLRRLLKSLESDHNIEVCPTCGEMTETGPCGNFGRRFCPAQQAKFDREEVQAGDTVLYGAQIRILERSQQALSLGARKHIGAPAGARPIHHFLVTSSRTAPPGGCRCRLEWFSTGDVASIDSDGYLKIVDREKDLVKSGGEWISSIDVENTAGSHPGVSESRCNRDAP